MNILSLTAGAASMYCGSCLRDNALAAELLARGHAVTLLPIYTPTLTDEPNVSLGRVFFGGVSVYLEQYVPLFRWTPAFLDRLWDGASVIRRFANRQIKVEPRLLGEMTVSMLRGEHGHQRKELGKLIAWLRTQPAPDVINLPFTLLIALARPLRDAFGVPICCTLQGEDLFLDQLREPYKNESLRLIRQQVKQIDRFVAVSDYYARYMAGYLSIPAERIRTVPIGINPRDFEPPASERTTSSAQTPASPSPSSTFRWPLTPDVGPRPFTIGYFGRIAPEKGLDRLAVAYRLLRKERGLPPSRLDVAGYLGAEHREYLERVELSLSQVGLHDEFRYRGELDRAAKIAFFKEIDVFSMPAPYREPKGMSVLEAMASGVPVVQPRHGAFPELLEKTGGGILVNPHDAESLAEGLWQLFQDRTERERLGQRGIAGVREHYTIQRMAEGMLDVFNELTADAHGPTRESASSTPPIEALSKSTGATPADETATQKSAAFSKTGPLKAAPTNAEGAASAAARAGSTFGRGGRF
jgi:glycosyltransferase involved in cell wall biosynthesis